MHFNEQQQCRTNLYRQWSFSYAGAPSVPRDPRPELLLLLLHHSNWRDLPLTRFSLTHNSVHGSFLCTHINFSVGCSMLFPLISYLFLHMFHLKLNQDFFQRLNSNKFAQYVWLVCYNSTMTPSAKRNNLESGSHYLMIASKKWKCNCEKRGWKQNGDCSYVITHSLTLMWAA